VAVGVNEVIVDEHLIEGLQAEVGEAKVLRRARLEQELRERHTFLEGLSEHAGAYEGLDGLRKNYVRVLLEFLVK
jgi:hypothetical protein